MLVDSSVSKAIGSGSASRAKKKTQAIQKRHRPDAVVPRAKKLDRAVQKRRAIINVELDRIYEQRGTLNKVMLVDVAAGVTG